MFGYNSNPFSCTTVRYTVPLHQIRSLHCYRQYARHVLTTFEHLHSCDGVDEKQRMIVFHLFSMNGAALFCSLWDLLDTMPNGADFKQRTRGIIFDRLVPKNKLSSV